jgi:hypothetical protein
MQKGDVLIPYLITQSQKERMIYVLCGTAPTMVSIPQSTLPLFGYP